MHDENIKRLMEQVLATSIGKTSIDPAVYMGTTNKSWGLPLPKTTDPVVIQLHSEFVRYTIQRELYTFGAFVSQTVAVDQNKAINEDVNKLMHKLQTQTQELINQGIAFEALVVHYETRKTVNILIFKIKKGVGGMITNIEKVEELCQFYPNIPENNNGAPMSDFFNGIKNSVFLNSPELISEIESMWKKFKENIEARG